MRVMGSHCLPKQPVFFDYSTPELAFLSLSNSPLLAKYIGKDAYDKSKKLCQAIYCINAPYDFVVKKINVERCIKHLPTFSSFISNVKVNEKVKKTVNMIDTIGEIGLVGSERQVKKDLKELHKI
ncbi:MAG: hypothetical protein LBB45_04045 [Methanobrevibacter sp.]|jgi:hypothetical protein|nr:hypothetical protein [Candidatus Methanovirga basalitermitum]